MAVSDTPGDQTEPVAETGDDQDQQPDDQDQQPDEGSSPWGGLDLSGLSGSVPGMGADGSEELGDMSDMLNQVQQMQQQLMQAQEALAEAEFSGSAGGDLVHATVSGTGELLSLSIQPAACDPADTDTLADMVVAAVRAAMDRQRAEAASKLGPMAGGLGL